MGLQLLLKVDKRVLLELSLACNLSWVILVFPIGTDGLLLQAVKSLCWDRIGSFALIRHRTLSNLVANKIIALDLILKRLVELYRSLRVGAIPPARDLLFLHLQQVNHSLDRLLLLAVYCIQIFLVFRLQLF